MMTYPASEHPLAMVLASGAHRPGVDSTFIQPKAVKVNFDPPTNVRHLHVCNQMVPENTDRLPLKESPRPLLKAKIIFVSFESELSLLPKPPLPLPLVDARDGMLGSWKLLMFVTNVSFLGG